MKLNEKLIKLRKEQGLSQEEFGYKINVSRQAVSKWESEQAVPEVDKIKEIGKVFNISFDYLLNDELEEIPERITQDKVVSGNKKGMIIVKIILAIFIIYLIVCLYKFIALYHFYKVADSFSEENYYMSQNIKNDKDVNTYINTTKVGNKRIIEMSNKYDGSEPFSVEYLDSEKSIWYEIRYNEETGVYKYRDKKQDAINEEELNKALNMKEDYLKQFTLGIIPSDLKSILNYSINPICYVSINNREIYMNNFSRFKMKITFNNDYLVKNYVVTSEFDGSFKINVSYDYVQNHFKDIENPLEMYKDKIEY